MTAKRNRRKGPAIDYTREEWLTQLVHIFHDKLFSGHDNVSATLPTFRISCSWPGGGSPRSRIGECWHQNASADGAIEMFISPNISDPMDAAATIVHEMVHMYLFNAGYANHGHGRVFRQLAVMVGLTGKMTATVASDALKVKLAEWMARLPEYPHSKLNTSSRKKQTTRMIKVTCDDSDCGMVFRTTSKWVEQAEGELSCPICNGYTTVG